MTSQSLLFVRSVPLTVAIPALRWLRSAAPDAAITVLTSSGAQATLTDGALADRVEVFDGHRLSIITAGPQRLWRLIRQRYDVIVVPYTGSRRAYWNVVRLAWAVRGRSVVWLPCDGLAELQSTSRMAPATLADWWREQSVAANLRTAALKAVKWPLLVMLYGVGMTALTILALILLPMVWLAPSGERGR